MFAKSVIAVVFAVGVALVSAKELGYKNCAENKASITGVYVEDCALDGSPCVFDLFRKYTMSANFTTSAEGMEDPVIVVKTDGKEDHVGSAMLFRVQKPALPNSEQTVTLGAVFDEPRSVVPLQLIIKDRNKAEAELCIEIQAEMPVTRDIKF